MSSSEAVKEVPVVVVDEKDGRSETSETPNSWQPSLKRKMPWFGLTALFFVILTSIGQALILLFADARAAYDWPEYISPNVCLSILNGVASLAIAFAVVQGIAIAWWRQALLGASIKELHYTWNFSTSIASIFVKYRYFNVIALAALMAKVAIIDGILFQRAIQTYISISFRDPEPGDPSTLLAWSMAQFPVTGVTGANQDSEGQLSYDFSNAVANWISTGYGVNTYTPLLPHCYGAACVFGLPGSGFSVSCQEHNNTDLFVETAQNASQSTNKTIFSIDFDIVYPNANKPYTWIQMNATWPVTQANDRDDSIQCPTVFTTSTCELRPAILNYTTFYVNTSTIERSKMRSSSGSKNNGWSNLGYSGSQMSFSCAAANESSAGLSIYGGYFNDANCGMYKLGQNQVKGVEILNITDLTDAWAPAVPSKLQGILDTLRDSFGSRATLVYTFGEWTVSQNSLFPSLLATSIPEESTNCSYSYLDPRTTIVNRLNLLMSQVSTYDKLFAGNESTDAEGHQIFNRVVDTRQYFKDIYYETDYKFMGIALGLTLVVVLCILPSYWGFWQLGRDVTLGPLEIAYAFQGPAFQSVHGVNGQADVVVKTVGKTRVQYGEIEDSEGKRLGFKMA